MRRMIAGALSVSMAACASAPPSGPYIMPLGEARIAQLVGGSPSEVRAALGAPTDETPLIFDQASLVDGVRVVTVGYNRVFVGSNPCADGYRLDRLNARDEERGYRVDALVFHDGRLNHVVGLSGGVPLGPLPGEARLLSQCRRVSHSTTGSGAGDVIMGVGAIVWFAPLIGVALAGAAVGSTMDESDQRAHALGVIRLGAPLPGDVDAYMAAHPQAVRLTQRDGDNVSLGIQLSEGDRHESSWFTLAVRDGIVQSVSAPSNRVCRLEDDGSVQCQQ